jgi:hypothetical protein
MKVKPVGSGTKWTTKLWLAGMLLFMKMLKVHAEVAVPKNWQTHLIHLIEHVPQLIETTVRVSRRPVQHLMLSQHEHHRG